jgi:hypothetical protein
MNQIMMGYRFKMERLTWMRGVLSYINRNIIDSFNLYQCFSSLSILNIHSNIL